MTLGDNLSSSVPFFVASIGHSLALPLPVDLKVQQYDILACVWLVVWSGTGRDEPSFGSVWYGWSHP